MNRKAEIRGAILFLFVGIAFTIVANRIPAPMLQLDTNTTPATFPTMIGLLFSLISLGLLIKTIFSPAALENPSPINVWKWVRTMKYSIAVIGTLLLYLIAMQIIGWIVSSFLMIVSIFMIIRSKEESKSKVSQIIVLGIVITTMIFIIFDLLLGVPLPKGVFSFELLK